MAKEKNPFLRTEAVDGIDVTIDTRALEDMRFFKVFTRLNRLDEEREETGDDPKASGRISVEMMDALDELAERVFGERTGEYQRAVSERNGGYLVFSDWLGFVMDTVMAFSQKNAEARPSAGGE